MSINLGKINTQSRRDVHYRTRHENYEYLARLAYVAKHNAIQTVIDELIFSNGWQRKLESLRKQQRRQGIHDHEFFHPSIRRELGLKIKIGRRPKRRAHR